MSECTWRAASGAGAESGRSGRRAHASAPDLVLLHGAGGGAWEWTRWVRLLRARGWVVHVPDFSRACTASALTDASAFSQLRTELLERLSSNANCVLVGASLGGLLAAAMANRLQARALILLNPAPPALAAKQSLDVVVAQDDRPWGLRASVVGTQRAVTELHALDVLRVFRRWSDCSHRLLQEIGDGIAVPRPSMPCLLLSSDSDAELSIESGRLLAARWGAEQRCLQGTHVGPLLGTEAGAAVTEVVGWLRTRGL